MKFSIIICTYNSVNKLPKTLDSILAQTYDGFEAVVIDGASMDGTLDIIRDYEKKFSGKLKWISEKDSGIFNAMNKGIDLAKRDWLYFLGAGDILYDRNVLENIKQEISKAIADIIYGDVMMGESGKEYDREFTKEKIIQKNISHQAIFFRKEIFNKLGKFNTRYKTLADWEFNMRWINDINIVSKYVDLPIAKFELGGTSKKIFDKKFYSDFEKNIKRYFPKDCFEFYKKTKKKEIDFLKNRSRWKLWELKNKIVFVIFHPKIFSKKYLKK